LRQRVQLRDDRHLNSRRRWRWRQRRIEPRPAGRNDLRGGALAKTSARNTAQTIDACFMEGIS
jgi:hypothetical protein